MQLNELVRILIIDDDPDCRMLVRDCIEGARIMNEVFEVEDGEQALDFLNQRGAFSNAPLPGLIYLDINMPGMDGLEVLRQIKSDHRFQHIPVVMMTSLDDDLEKSKAAEYGANSYTIKPSRPEQFVTTVVASTQYWLGIHCHTHTSAAA
jgi:CheY-like chemotaxis protein